MLASLLLGVRLMMPADLDHYDLGPYEPSVPRPESILGYPIGSRITTYRDQEAVILAIAEKAGARVKAFTYGKSVEGRPLRVLAISSPENIKRLEEIRQDTQKIAQGQASAELIAKTPATVWINECIHGNEPASFESAMPLLYNLAASKSNTISGSLKDVVVILNPVYNPDGHERYAVWYNSVSTGTPDPFGFEHNEPRVIAGRSNHYRFDMNRDRVSFSQDETRQEVREFLRWNPQVYVDQHGQVATYFFPPNPMSVNANVDRDRFNKWTDVFGKATARMFDEKGYLYYIADNFDLYYPGYLDSYTSLAGAIGMTHETDGGKPLAKLRDDGTVVTLRNGIDKHLTAAYAVIRATAENRSGLVTGYAAFKRKAVSGSFAGKFQRVVVTSEDPRPLKRLQDQLGRAGVVSHFAAKPFRQADAHDYWSDANEGQEFPAGSLVIDMAQSQGPIAKALLEPGSDFEKAFVDAQRGKKNTAPEGETYPGPENSEFYDLTGWSLPYAHNLKAWWCESAPKIDLSETVSLESRIGGKNTVGYYLEYRDQNDILAAFDLLNAGLKVSVAHRAMKVGGRELAKGTFLVLNERNAEGFEKHLEATAAKRQVKFESLKTGYPDQERWGPGSDTVRALNKPEIGVIFGRGADITSVGPMWYLMEREFHLPFTALSSDVVNRDLSKFTCLVAPSGSAILATTRLKEWVQNGGILVLFDAPSWVLGSSGFVTLEEQKVQAQSLPGALFLAKLDTRSPLSYGHTSDRIAVPVAGSGFFKARKEGGSVVTFDAEPKDVRLLSGWTYPEETEKALAGSVWLQAVRNGRGSVVIFTQDPTERVIWSGLNKILLNSMLLGG